MHRRARHLNPIHAGALISIDSRFLTGTNGSALATWAGRAGQSGNFTSSGTNQPTYNTNKNGGNPAVTFDGSNDIMTRSGSAGNRTLPQCTIIVGARLSGTAEACFYDTSNHHAVTHLTNTLRWYSLNSKDFTIGSIANATIISVADDGTGGAIAYLNGASSGSVTGLDNAASGSDASNITIGAVSGPALAINCDMYACIDIPLNLPSPLRRRIEQSCSASFKIACS
jgi:hypothetical protein